MMSSPSARAAHIASDYVVTVNFRSTAVAERTRSSSVVDCLNLSHQIVWSWGRTSKAASCSL